MNVQRTGWSDEQLAAVTAQLARVRHSIEEYDRERAHERDIEALTGVYWSRELTDDEPEADDLWDDAQDTERFARGLGFDSYDEYHAASDEAFAAWVDGQHTYEHAE